MIIKIVHIFAHRLFAFHYEGEEANELERLFDQWQDIEYLFEFFEEHAGDLLNGFFDPISVEDAVTETRAEAKLLEEQLMSLCDSDDGSSLESIFKLLDNRHYRVIQLEKHKAYGSRRRSWLRLYAIRIEKDTYIITGGAIKLTHTMNERHHTKKELDKLSRCRDWLIDNQLIDREGLIEELET